MIVSKNLVHIGHTKANSKLDIDVREFKKAFKELAKSNSTLPLQHNNNNSLFILSSSNFFSKSRLELRVCIVLKS